MKADEIRAYVAELQPAILTVYECLVDAATRIAQKRTELCRASDALDKAVIQRSKSGGLPADFEFSLLMLRGMAAAVDLQLLLPLRYLVHIEVRLSQLSREAMRLAKEPRFRDFLHYAVLVSLVTQNVERFVEGPLVKGVALSADLAVGLAMARDLLVSRRSKEQPSRDVQARALFAERKTTVKRLEGALPRFSRLLDRVQVSSIISECERLRNQLATSRKAPASASARSRPARPRSSGS